MTTTTQPHARVDDLWRRLAGMFGADVLARKFGDAPTPEWAALVQQLKDFELERGMRRLIRSGKSYVPALPEFARMCREIGRDDDSDEQAIPMARRIAPQPLGRWEREADDHLMAYLWRQGLVGVYHVSEHMRRHPMPAQADQQSRELMQPLLDAKAAWASDMRDAETEGKVPADGGREWWQYVMGNAENAVDLVRSRYAVKAH